MTTENAPSGLLTMPRGLDALGRRNHLRLCRGRGHNGVGLRIRQRQDGQPLGLGPVAGVVGLDVAAVETHGVAVDGLIRAGDEAVKEEQQVPGPARWPQWR